MGLFFVVKMFTLVALQPHYNLDYIKNEFF
jgi:hypothetical protein